jgi:polar amino acid transport system ATP-binding protein
MSALVTGTAPLVSIEGVWKSFGELEVLRGIDLAIAAGEVTCVLGPSGSGKSTLLRCVNHIERVDRGYVRVCGDLMGYREQDGKLHELPERAVCRQRARIGMVFQQFNLFPHLSVLENVIEAPMRVQGVPGAVAVDRARELLGKVGLLAKVDAYPRELSGGQQQRVAIARAVATGPQLMLFDEPTSALDPELVGEVLDAIRALAEEGMTMMIVTHEIGFARELADTVVFMDDGLVVESGTPSAVLDQPSQERTRGFLSKVL